MITPDAVTVRPTEPRDDEGITSLSLAVYPETKPWAAEHLASHRLMFPEGQLVAVMGPEERVVGMAASLIVLWDDYSMNLDWLRFTDKGMFTNHDAEHGRTLYGAEVMVHPSLQGRGIGKQLYAARRALVERLGLLRIRAGARLRGYHRVAAQMSAEQYAIEVIHGRIVDRTLTFQLRQGFEVIAVVAGYLLHDPESLGHAAVIEWVNPAMADQIDRSGRDPRFMA